jgi:CCR4-NOT transcription complex subunit 9
MEQIKLYRKIKDYNKLFDRKLSQITRNIMPKSIRRTLSAFQNIRNSSPNFYDSYRNICSNNIKKINKNSNLSLKRKNKYRQLNSSNSNINYHNISANSNKKKSINYFRKKTPHRVNSQRKEITPNLKINNNFHNLYSNSNSKGKMLFNDNLRSSLDNSNHKRQFKKINISNVNNISAPNNHFNSYNSTKDSNKVNNLINNDNNLKNNNKINHNNNHIDGMLNNVLIIANIKNKFEVNTVSHGANKHSSFKKFKYNLSGNSVSSNK